MHIDIHQGFHEAIRILAYNSCGGPSTLFFSEYFLGADAKYGPFLKAMSGADSVQARRFAAAKALEIGWGGVSKVSDLTGLSRKTIVKGLQELENEDELEPPKRLRKPGGGRKKAEDKDLTLMNDLEEITKETTEADLMSLLKWTYKSTYAIAEELQLKGHDVSHDTVRCLLKIVISKRL